MDRLKCLLESVVDGWASRGGRPQGVCSSDAKGPPGRGRRSMQVSRTVSCRLAQGGEAMSAKARGLSYAEFLKKDQGCSRGDAGFNAARMRLLVMYGFPEPSALTRDLHLTNLTAPACGKAVSGRWY